MRTVTFIAVRTVNLPLQYRLAAGLQPDVGLEVTSYSESILADDATTALEIE